MASRFAPRRIVVRGATWLTGAKVLRGHGAPGRSFALAATTFDGGVVMLDPSGGRVGRTFEGIRIDREQSRLRSEQARYVSLPALLEHREPNFLVEEFVEGAHLADLGFADQERAIGSALRQHAELTAATALRDRGSTMRRNLRRALLGDLRHVLPEELLGSVGDERLLSRCLSWPAVASVGDPHPKNLIIDDDLTPTFVDAWPHSRELFFADPCAVLAVLPRSAPRLRRHAQTGGFDGDLERLFRAAGVELRIDRQVRRSLLAISIVTVALRRAATGDGLDQEVLSQCSQRWHGNSTLAEPPATWGAGHGP